MSIQPLFEISFNPTHMWPAALTIRAEMHVRIRFVRIYMYYVNTRCVQICMYIFM
jgi:hypothetical protein